MALTRNRIKQIVAFELESGTNALDEGEVEELSASIAEKITAEDGDVYDDDDDGDADERTIESDVEE